MATEIDELKASIKEKGYDWTPAETSVSKLSEEEQKNRLCLLVTEKELEQVRMMTTELKEKISYPSSFVWRNYNGKNWTLPIRGIGYCGACVAFGTVVAIESTMRIINNNSNLAVDLFEASLLFCGDGNCNGWIFEPL